MTRIGVNALHLIPGAVGGTEIYLRELLAALAVGQVDVGRNVLHRLLGRAISSGSHAHLSATKGRSLAVIAGRGRRLN